MTGEMQSWLLTLRCLLHCRDYTSTYVVLESSLFVLNCDIGFLNCGRFRSTIFDAVYVVSNAVKKGVFS